MPDDPKPNALAGYNQELMQALMENPDKTLTQRYAPNLREQWWMPNMLADFLTEAPAALMGFRGLPAGRTNLTGLPPTHPPSQPMGGPITNSMLPNEAMVPASRPYSGIATSVDDFGRLASSLKPHNAIDGSPNMNYNVPDVNLLVGGKALEPPAPHAPDYAVSAYRELLRAQGDVGSARQALMKDPKAQNILNYWDSLGINTGRPGWSVTEGGK